MEPWNFMTFHILGSSSSQLTFIFFREVGIPPTRYIYIYTYKKGRIKIPYDHQPTRVYCSHECHSYLKSLPSCSSTRKSFWSMRDETFLRLNWIGTFCLLSWGINMHIIYHICDGWNLVETVELILIYSASNYAWKSIGWHRGNIRQLYWVERLCLYWRDFTSPGCPLVKSQ